VIGLEVHVQLRTKSKMFCRCDNDAGGAKPNQHTCPVCLGMPGTLPVPNRQAVEWAIKASLALGCEVPAESKFDRKQYFYPDLPKGYQISQYDQPLGGPGKFEFDMVEDGKPAAKQVRITRLHLEEDAGKLTHPGGADYSLVDLNRAGTPLMEIVTEPDLRSPAEAKAFMQELRLVMRYLGVSDADMEKGHLRADANISVRPAGAKPHGTKTELKNLNSFKFVERGLAAEYARQVQVLKDGGEITQETRGFTERTGKTVSQRGKEEAHDYRYFPEPDIPPLAPQALDLKSVKPEVTDLPTSRRRAWRKLGVPEEVIGVAAQNPQEADAFGQSVAQAKDAPTAARLWLLGRTEAKFRADGFKRLTEFAAAAASVKGLSGPQTKRLAEQFLKTGRPIAGLLKDKSFQSVDESDLEAIVDEAIKQNPKPAADFKAGNANAKQVLVGFVMKRTKGSADPGAAAALIAKKLGK
jgi:aspartyl-tRNA(Asn)/glutamyl-tRNA(Gln) amidotransferase subunit B